MSHGAAAQGSGGHGSQDAPIAVEFDALGASGFGGILQTLTDVPKPGDKAFETVRQDRPYSTKRQDGMAAQRRDKPFKTERV